MNWYTVVSKDKTDVVLKYLGEKQLGCPNFLLSSIQRRSFFAITIFYDDSYDQTVIPLLLNELLVKKNTIKVLCIFFWKQYQKIFTSNAGLLSKKDDALQEDALTSLYRASKSSPWASRRGHSGPKSYSTAARNMAPPHFRPGQKFAVLKTKASDIKFSYLYTKILFRLFDFS